MDKEYKYFSFFGEIPYCEPAEYFDDPDAEYFSAFGEWDIVRFGDGHFAYTKLQCEEE